MVIAKYFLLTEIRIFTLIMHVIIIEYFGFAIKYIFAKFLLNGKEK